MATQVRVRFKINEVGWVQELLKNKTLHAQIMDAAQAAKGPGVRVEEWIGWDRNGADISGAMAAETHRGVVTQALGRVHL